MAMIGPRLSSLNSLNDVIGPGQTTHGILILVIAFETGIRF